MSLPPTSPWQMDQRLLLHGVQAPRSVRVLARVLVALLLVTVLCLTITPWQQNIAGAGRLIAFNPEQRVQDIEAPVDGRVVRWHVVEGSRVRRGDPVVDLADNDPSIIQRMRDERDFIARTIGEGELRARSLEDRIGGLIETRDSSVVAAELRQRMADERTVAAEQAVTAARAAKVTADLNIERQRALLTKGLTSVRSVEVAELEAATRDAEVARAVASLNAARSEAASLGAELRRTRADAVTRVDEARATLASANSDLAKARAELAKMEVRLARQETQHVSAPVDGTILRVVARQSGELLKAGTTLAVIVPASTQNVVELWVDGNDMPMVKAGDPVRLQFEGWPALQFSGWPALAVGTFGGRVQLVDPTDNGNGRFRVLVGPDRQDTPWPSERFLRQGVRANGWVLLSVVPLGYELWRQFNGFPPVTTLDEPAAYASSAAGAKGGDKAAGGADSGEDK